MPILQQNDAAAVARYTEFVTRSPWGNLMQDRGWAHVKKGWVCLLYTSPSPRDRG